MTTRKLVAVIAAVALAILVIPLVWMAFFGWGMMGSGQGMYNNGGGWGMMGSGQGMYNNGNGGNDNGMMSNNGAMSDRVFVEMMIPHHQGAIEMARVALRHAKDPETKRMAQKIIDDQEREIVEMRDWLKRHGK